MEHSYTLNTNNARQVGVSARIDALGAYSGVFTRAEAVKSSRGTLGIEFSFRSQDGQSADYLTLWTTNPDGKELYGRKVVDALMTCLRVRSINTKNAMIKKWDSAARMEQNVNAIIFPDLMNKPIGLLMVREEYEKTDGSTDWKMAIVGCYDVTTHLTPREILDQQTKPEQLAQMIQSLRDRPLRKRSNGAAGGGHATGGGFDMDDDIPFN